MKCNLLARLYLGKLSRDRLNYDSTTDHRWSEFQFLKKAFVSRHPELEKDLNEFIKKEKDQWRGLFTDKFKIDSFANFVTKRIDKSEYTY